VESLRAEESNHHGFAGNPKKFNVATTRASEVLVVVGNPSVVLLDRCWGAFLRHALRTGCYSGVSFPEMEGAAAEGTPSGPADPPAAEAPGLGPPTDYSALAADPAGWAEPADEDFDAREYAFIDGEDVPWRVML
jgi:hypothetical protein